MREGFQDYLEIITADLYPTKSTSAPATHFLMLSISRPRASCPGEIAGRTKDRYANARKPVRGYVEPRPGRGGIEPGRRRAYNRLSGLKGARYVQDGRLSNAALGCNAMSHS